MSTESTSQACEEHVYWCAVTIRMMSNVTRLMYRTVHAINPLEATRTICREHQGVELIKVYKFDYETGEKEYHPELVMDYKEKGNDRESTTPVTPATPPNAPPAVGGYVAPSSESDVFSGWATPADAPAPLVTIKLKDTEVSI